MSKPIIGNPSLEEACQMMKMESQSSLRPGSRGVGQVGVFPAGLKISGHVLSIAGDIGALEECLALERATGSSVSMSEGIQSPPAVPFCEVLMLRALDGSLKAVCRIMRLDRNNPIRNPLESGRFQLSPLLTALRYSREGIVEMGIPTIAEGFDRAKAARLLWTGLVKYVERNGIGFVIGREILPMRAEEVKAWPALMEAHGLHPDLEVEARPSFSLRDSKTIISKSDQTSPVSVASNLSNCSEAWPAGLQEALWRGCRLACEPAYNAGEGTLEFVWVASRDMLEGSETGDWRGANFT